MSERINQERARFEAWAESMPYERSTDRLGSDDSWPGHYRDYLVQLAWVAWLEALQMSDVQDG